MPHILVIKLGALGDFIQALGPMAAIRKHHEDARITLLTTKPFEALAKACGYFDDVMLDTRPRWHDLKGWMDLRRVLNAGRFTRVYDLQNNDRTALYLKLFAQKPEWVGAARGATIRNNSPERTEGKAYAGHVQTLSLAGILDIRPDTLAWLEGRNDFEGLAAPYILIVPGSAATHPEKRWPVTHYAAICERLLSHGFLPVLLGTSAESDVLAAIHKYVPRCLNLCGATALFDIPSLARGAAGAIGNDTGPMHLIAPTGCPSIILFSKNTNPKKHAPMGGDVITLQKDVLEDLNPDEVWKAFAAQHASS